MLEYLCANKNCKEYAKGLRKNMTKEEKHLWYDFLRGYTPQFKRQKAIGNYILDFYCEKAHIAVELDGSQHYETKAREYDSKRTEYLNHIGIDVLRILNRDINEDFESACRYIDAKIKEKIG